MSPGGNESSSFVLLDLFREEARTHVETLNTGLVGLEQGEASPQTIEPLMRAAHSLKGAARVVNLALAAELSHALEDVLVGAQEGQLILSASTAESVDLLLRAVDLLEEMIDAAGATFAAWEEAHAHRVQELLPLLQSLRDRQMTPVSQPPLSPPAPPAAPPEPITEEEPAPALDLGLSVQAIPEGPVLELYRQEVSGNVEILKPGVQALSGSSASADAIEPLVRAAHGIRGAARLAGVDVAALLASRLEEVLTRGRQEPALFTSRASERLGEAIDLLAELGAAGPELPSWFMEQEDRVQAVLGQLEVLASVQKKQEEAKPRAAEERHLPAAPLPAVPLDEVPTVVHPPATPIRSVTPALPAGPGEAEDRVVRVKAQSLNRLMGLAGESLVEARWLQPFAASLVKLKRHQDHLADDLDELCQLLTTDAFPLEGRSLAEEARNRLAECRRVLMDRISEFEVHARQSDDLNSRLYHEVLASRMRPFGDGVKGYPRLVRDLARQLGKKVHLEIQGEMTDVDRDILEKLEGPLNHLIRNALDHGMETPDERLRAGKLETGQILVEAGHNAGMLCVTVADDGQGIDVERLRAKVVERGYTSAEMAANLGKGELLEFLFLPGFSTSGQVTEVSGRGVGLDVVHSMVTAVGGSARVTTRLGEGTAFYLQLPLTLSVIRAVLVNIAGDPYAFPHNRIHRLLRLSRHQLQSLEGRQFLEVDGLNVGVVLGRQLFEVEGSEESGEDFFIVLFGDQNALYGLIVDGFLGEQDLVVRPLDTRLGKVPNINAAAILDDGSPVLIADLDDLRRSVEKLLHGGRLRRVDRQSRPRKERRTKRVLVVDDSITVREMERQLLLQRGYEVEVAVDGMDGWNLVREGTFDLIISDIDMPRLNGLDFVRMIKGEDRLRSIPVVIVSYKDRDEDRFRGLDAGADYYLTKSSFHDETLLDAVQELIGDPDA
jgi:two-component system sensor histidine kinase and response regulator WspE